MINLIKKYKIQILIVLLFVLSRLPSLGHEYFNTDVWKWKTRSYNFGSGVFSGNFIETNQKYHPGVTLMWIGTLGIKIYNIYLDIFFPSSTPETLGISYVFGLHFVQKLCVVVVLSITLAFCYSALEQLFGKRYAIITIFLISVEPFYVALSRVFHLEGLLSTFMLASVLWCYLYLEKGLYKQLLLSGIFAGFSILTKTSALYLLPFMGLGGFIYKYSNEGESMKSLPKVILDSLKVFGKWIPGVFLTFLILWPALWVDFAGVLTNLYRGITDIGVEGDHYQVFFGKIVEDPGIVYYPLVFLIRSSPYIIFGLIGYLIINKKVIKEKYGVFPLYLFLYFLFYIVQHSIPTKKLDRYVLPALIGLIPVTGIYFDKIIEKLNLYKKFFVFVFTLFPLLLLVRIHPDYFSYYNPLFGGLKFGAYAIEPKWLIGKNEIVNYFSKIKRDRFSQDIPCESFECVIDEGYTKEVLSVGFPEKYYTQTYPFFTEIGAWATIKDLTAFAKHTNYFVYPVWQDDSYAEDRFRIQYISSIKVRGVVLYNVYQRIEE